MKRPWMAFYVGDYLTDTVDLSVEQHGTYLLLLMLAWRHPSGTLPNNIKWLKSALPRMHGHTFNRLVPPILDRFFFINSDGKFENKRLTKERQTADKRSTKQSENARKRWFNVRNLNKIADANAYATHMPSQSHIEEPRGSSIRKYSDPNGSADEVVGEDPKARLFRIGKTQLASWGIAEKRTGALIGQWLKNVDPVGLLAAIQFARNHNVAEPVAYISALVNGKGQNGKGLGALANAANDLVTRRAQQTGEDAAFVLDLTAQRR